MDSLWIIMSLIAAFTGGTSDALTKRALLTCNVYAIAWLRQLVVVILLAPCLFIIPIPQINEDFFLAFLTALPFEVLAYIFFMKAIKISPLSLTVPFLSLTPICLMIIPYVMLGESVSFLGGAGILMIAIGSYTLNMKEIRKGFFEPIRAISREKGSLFMIITAILYGFTNTFGKQAIENSSALFFGVTYNIVFSMALSPVIFKIGKIHLHGHISKKALGAAIAPGIFAAITVIFYTVAMSLANVAYMVAVSRLSLLIGVIYGHFLFKETGFRERLTGTILMLIGFLIIALGHQ
jgi:drug/metabolite transporter (DMT)-like permease